MHRQFEEELEQLKQSVLAMAGLVERSVADVATALVERDTELADEIIRRDDEVDRLEIEIDRLATSTATRWRRARSSGATTRSTRCTGRCSASC